MKFLSVCSGIEAASVAWGPLGYDAVAFAEIDAFPCAVLKHHYPVVPNWGDVTKFQEWPDAVVDVLVGGTPCQSFSVAGLRAGLDDPRGSLMLTYLAVARRFRPRWLVWENVPGVLSSDDGRAFGSLLGGLAELGYGFAYRILDAQYFDLAQRRARVFVVGHLGDWRRAAAVLFERASLVTNDTMGALKVGGGKPGQGYPAVAFAHQAGGNNDCSGAYEVEMSPTLPKLQTMAVQRGMSVRRLTPRECERLQGFPDDYTLIPYRGKLAADGPRYKALGNSMAVPVMRWIGERIQQVSEVPA